MSLARAVIESEARRFIMQAQKPLRPGRGWILHITPVEDSAVGDTIPVEMLNGNFPNTLDAPYGLGDDVRLALEEEGLDPDAIVDGQMTRHVTEMDKYFGPIYRDVKQGKLHGTIAGIAGTYSWGLHDVGREEF